ncbi:hypothetical protein M9Y10_018823 [Tritrichomonas musculus]|uniref:Uncharacterized protein n=1 Tax=Tritrichomonas musculus TaxID=1915356 RepID=A0ABR2HHU0_9EUKA
MYLINLASLNRLKEAHFYVGYFYHNGYYIKRDIIKAIHYYKEGSSFNDQYAKNNLAIIYKKGYEDVIPANAANAIEYLEEAIRQKNDVLSMYNLANIYIYGDAFGNKIDKAIELLYNSLDQFNHSYTLFCLALVKKFGFQIELIEKYVEELNNKNSKVKVSSMTSYLSLWQLNDTFTFYYKSYQDNYFLYDHSRDFVSFSDFQKQKRTSSNHKNVTNINYLFYEGFGIEI